MGARPLTKEDFACMETGKTKLKGALPKWNTRDWRRWTKAKFHRWWREKKQKKKIRLRWGTGRQG